MQTHDLKTLPVYFDAVQCGDKTFEVRRDDRAFQKGDIVRLFCFDPARGYRTHSTGWHNSPGLRTEGQPYGGLAQIERRILWILSGGQFGVEPGYVILSLGPVDAEVRA